MNSFGEIFKITNYGESHGQGVGVIIDGCPVGIKILEEDFLFDLSRRRAGKIGTTKRIESDMPIILSGVLNGYSTGAPINIFFKNENINSKVYRDLKNHPRPGHSDFVSSSKYKGYNDLRGGGRFSGRITLTLVAAAVIAKKILKKKFKKLKIVSELVTLGNLNILESDEEKIKKYLESIQKEGDSIGGIVQCIAINPPKDLGEPFFDSLESIVSHLIFSIGGVRGIEFGSGFESSRMKGSQCNDLIINEKGETLTNNCGGINGGITNGNDIVFRVAVKPTSSIFKAQKTFSFSEKKVSKLILEGRHDVAFVLRVPVIVEACLAIALVELFLRNRNIEL